MCPGEAPDANYLSATGQGSLEESDLPEKCSRFPLLSICFTLFLLLPIPVRAAPQLDSDLSVSREGYFVLSWEAHESDSNLKLQQSSNSEFTREVEEWSVSGASQFTQSGLFNGEYYFRLVDEAGTSNTVHIQVVHHSLARASLFFILGAILFGILVVTLVLGRRGLRGGNSG